MRATIRARACKLMRDTGAAPFLAGALTMAAATFLVALVFRAFGLPHG
jgi:hypothetical protein